MEALCCAKIQPATSLPLVTVSFIIKIVGTPSFMQSAQKYLTILMISSLTPKIYICLFPSLLSNYLFPFLH